MEPEEWFANQAAELFTTQIERFGEWLAKGWELTERDNDACEEKMSADYMAGWNAALESIPLALKLYLDPEG